MQHPQLLQQLTQLEGVSAAAILTAEGEVLEHTPQAQDSLNWNEAEALFARLVKDMQSATDVLKGSVASMFLLYPSSSLLFIPFTRSEIKDTLPSREADHSIVLLLVQTTLLLQARAHARSLLQDIPAISAQS